MSSTAATEIKVSPAPAVITLAGKVAIVTGSSRGIGRGIALSLARDGAKLVINYHSDKKSADAVVAAIVSAGGAAISAQADVSKSADVDRLFAEAKKAFGRIDIVVANSGVAGALAHIGITTDDDFARVMATNLTGAFYTLRAAANNIENNGRIIVIGSISKKGTFPGYGPYAATKGAIEVLANTLAQELGSKGITVNTVHPGAVDTDMFGANAAPGIIEWAKSATPFGRLGTIFDLGDACSLLASESARWISGQSIDVSGATK